MCINSASMLVSSETCYNKESVFVSYMARYLGVLTTLVVWCVGGSKPPTVQ